MQDLRVDLSSFQGPLDLLLHLVQQEEVDIEDIPLAKIADRFLEACRGRVGSLDVDKAGEYLVMASQLLVLKSRALLPRDTGLDVEEIDPRLDLVRQLLEYRRFKGVATELLHRAEGEKDRLGVQVEGPDHVAPEDQDLEVDLYALVAAFQRLLKETSADTTVAMPRERLPITHFVGVIFDHLVASGGRLSFRDLIGAQPDRTYVIGAFLALLELIKVRKVIVDQDGFGEIGVRIREEALEVHGPVDQDLAARAIDQPDMGAPRSGPRIVFMGSPDFAVPALRSLIGAGMTPVLVVTPPPSPAGRGRRMQHVAVETEAASMDLPLHRTNDVNGRTSRDDVEAATPDVIVTAGFGQKLGGALLSLPPRGCLNLHASLLPKYRGASPVAAAIRDGANETGVTIFLMDEELDRGPVLASRAMPLTGDETAEEVTHALSEMAADLLVRTLPDYLAGLIEPKPQDHEQATYVARLKKEDGAIPWEKPANEVRNHVRSVTTWPGAQSSWQPKVKHEPLPVVVHATQAIEVPAPQPGAGQPVRPGTVIAVGPQGIDVACGEGALRILSLKPAGGRVLDAAAFLNGRRVVVGDRFL